jgi:lipoprotein signal peptidase
MNLLLSWNLFIIAIFIVIIAYSYIIGINKTVKTIIASYLAILAADGIGNIFKDYFLTSDGFK